jgi:hypothetical protein
MADEERARRDGADRLLWLQWGPYVSERAWGTVREDYSADGDAWHHFPYEQARSRAFRWSEDGLAGISDHRQTLCLAFAFWNGVDETLKERIFGLSGPQGNHGEDAKEYWWYLDCTPTHSWMCWRYHYPQAPFPYSDLITVNAQRSRLEPEYELIDTGVFDADRYWAITVEYAKAAPNDICVRLTICNAGPDAATIDALPTVWFRNTWAWESPDSVPSISAGATAEALVAQHQDLGRYTLVGDGEPDALFCDNETNAERLFGAPNRSPYPKDAMGDYVVHGLSTLNPDHAGTKGALRYRLTIEAGQSAEVRLRLSDSPGFARPDDAWEAAMRDRAREADEFYSSILPSNLSADDKMIARQSLAGMLWSKQYFHYDVERWLQGDPVGPPPPPERLTGRNSTWTHLNNRDIISMPDTWEYPWYAAWDLGFHCVALAHVDATFAKEQLVLLCREWYMHPNGQLPAYEWGFGDVNPPVHAWSALRVYELDGSRDREFLERVMHKLLLNFTWWVNRKDVAGTNVFEGGFLGLDNIGPIDRSAPLPQGEVLEQSDGTSWMALYCLTLLEMAIELATNDETYQDLATKFFEHFAYIATAMYEAGLWDDDDGFYYDVLQVSGDSRLPLKVRSMVGLLPLCATTTLGMATLAKMPEFAARMEWFIENKMHFARHVSQTHVLSGATGHLLAVVDPARLRRILSRMLDEREFLSPFGIRALSAVHRQEPFTLHLDGFEATVDYEPAESTTPLFGGNSNWRGPVWFPVNYLLIESLGRFATYLGEDFTVEHPTGSGRYVTLSQVAADLRQRLIAIFRLDGAGHRTVFGDEHRFDAPAWRDLIPFHEYFHGDTGKGLGASHQTGWTGLVADLLLRP